MLSLSFVVVPVALFLELVLEIVLLLALAILSRLLFVKFESAFFRGLFTSGEASLTEFVTRVFVLVVLAVLLKIRVSLIYDLLRYCFPI